MLLHPRAKQSVPPPSNSHYVGEGMEVTTEGLLPGLAEEDRFLVSLLNPPSQPTGTQSEAFAGGKLRWGLVKDRERSDIRKCFMD